MRIGTLFSGIGSPEQAAKRVYKNNLELIFACEWDKFARESFNANYKIQAKHFHKDISDMDGNKYKYKIDILIGGSPCQDFSLAGLRKGIEGNKGILIYEYIRIIKEIKPPIFIYENVKGMLSDKYGKTIKEFVEVFRNMGYNCHLELLNTKDYGIPQNRERIFLVGFKNVDHYYNFSFAPNIKLEKRLKDILEKDIEEKYYLSEDSIKFYKSNSEKNKEVGNVIKIPYADKKGYKEVGIGDTINLSFVNNPNSRGTCRTDGIANTLDTTCNQASIDENFRIRKLTPRECFRLQDFPDTFRFVVSNSQLYKQVGNTMSINVMEMIFNQIEKARIKNTNIGSLL